MDMYNVKQIAMGSILLWMEQDNDRQLELVSIFDLVKNLTQHHRSYLLI